MMNIQEQTQTTGLNNTNKLLVPQAESALDMFKMEIAQEMGITLGAETTARENGRVGGEMTRRLVKLGEEYLASQQANQNNTLH